MHPLQQSLPLNASFIAIWYGIPTAQNSFRLPYSSPSFYSIAGSILQILRTFPVYHSVDDLQTSISHEIPYPNMYSHFQEILSPLPFSPPTYTYYRKPYKTPWHKLLHAVFIAFGGQRFPHWFAFIRGTEVGTSWESRASL